MSTFKINIKPFGEAAILIEWANKVDEAILTDIIQFKSYLQSCFHSSEVEMVSAYNSLTLIFQSPVLHFHKVKEKIQDWYQEKATSEAKTISKTWEILVCYEEHFGIDLGSLTESLGLTKEEIIELHTGAIYTIYAIGFLPGFMYLGGLPKALEIPRKEVPRLKVMRGAVAIAGQQTGVYPQDSPGGWHIIGNSPILFFDVNSPHYCFVNAGDKIKFKSISLEKHQEIAAQTTYTPSLFY